MLPRPRVRPATTAVDEPRRARPRQRGQSLVEFAIVLPVLLAIVGVVIDASRVYQGWVNLESATRDAAQYLATSNIDPTSPDYTTQGVNSDGKAAYILHEATGVTFTRSPTQGTLTDCNQPQVTTTYSADTSLASGGTVSNPLGKAKVMACIPFRTLFAYPFLTTNGAWIIRSDREYKILVGR